MLTQIHIRNFTMIQSLSLDLKNGLSVLTGETGAGKSIWIDAIHYASGTRSDNSVIRHGQACCELILCFDLSQHTTVQQWLKDEQYEEAANTSLVLRRLIIRDKPSRASINGRPCSLQVLRTVSALLLNIHEQNQNQNILKSSAQIECLDHFADQDTLATAVKHCYQHWQAAKNEHLQFTATQESLTAERALLEYQTKELEQLNLQEKEWTELSQKHQALSERHTLLQQLHQILALMVETEDTSVMELLQNINQQLEAVQPATPVPAIESAKALLNTANIHLQEASHELNQYRCGLELDPATLKTIEERLSNIYDMARKYRSTPDQLLEIQASIHAKLQQLQDADNDEAKLKKKQQHYEQEYQQLAKQLSAARKQAAQALETYMTNSMHQLGIEKGLFKILLEDRADPIHPNGFESVQFIVRTNPGQPLQTLAKVLSGGELSRINLALRVASTKRKDTKLTLLFDEIDAGIGGKTATTVGHLLRELGKSNQVLCVTHSAQIAALGQQHYQIKKSSQQESTQTTITPLNPAERVCELARMLGGTKITEKTMAHAQELLCMESCSLD